MRRAQAILRAAETLFHQRSFDGTGVDAIAREAGIVGSAVYRHFGSKDDILLALLDQAVDELVARTETVADDDPWAEIHTLISAHVGVAVSHPQLVDIWQREQHTLTGAAADGFHQRQREYVDRWTTCLGRCYPEQDRPTLVSAVIAVHALMTSGSAGRGNRHPEPPRGPLLEAMARAALSALSIPDQTI